MQQLLAGLILVMPCNLFTLLPKPGAVSQLKHSPLVEIPGTGSRPVNLAEYYQRIHAAESEIMDSQWRKASDLYLSAFRLTQQPFARHVYNSMMLHARLGEPDSVSARLRFLVARGAGLATLRKKKELDDYWTTRQGQASLQEIPSLKVTFDTSYRHTLERMFERDQQFRRLATSLEPFTDTIRRIDHDNILQLQQLIAQKGFPSESRIGIGPDTFAAPYYYILLIHQANGPGQQFNLADILEEAIAAGDLENRLGSMLINHMNGRYTFGYDVTRLLLVRLIDSTKSAARTSNQVPLDSTAFGYFPLNEDELKKMNAERGRYFLDDYHASLRKGLYERRHPGFLLGDNLAGSSMILRSRADFEETRKLLRLE